MKGYIANIEKVSLENKYFRQVLYTTKNSQLVVMSLKPNEDIGEEIHQLDQFIRCEKGQGKAILNGIESELNDGFVVIVPAGTKHNVINTSAEETLHFILFILHQITKTARFTKPKLKQNSTKKSILTARQRSNPMNKISIQELVSLQN